MPHAPVVRAAIALTAAALAACRDLPPTAAPAAAERPQLITNGSPTGTSYGNVGALLIDVGADFVAEFLCTGTLVSPTVFLTAGHCTSFPAGTQYFVSFQPVISAPFIQATAAYTHPAFSFPFNDLGVVTLPAGSTTGITPAPLPPLGYLDDAFARGGHALTPAIMVGYGSTSLGRGNLEPTGGGERLVAETRILRTLDEFLILASNAVNAGKGGSCFGDSGGPIFLGGDAAGTIVGVTSFVTDGRCIVHSGYVRIDTETARSFLDDFVALP
jgi:hypothetical protein